MPQQALQCVADLRGDSIGTVAVIRLGFPGGQCGGELRSKTGQPTADALPKPTRQRSELAVLRRGRVPDAIEIGRPRGEQGRLPEASAGDDDSQAFVEELVEPLLECRTAEDRGQNGRRRAARRPRDRTRRSGTDCRHPLSPVITLAAAPVNPSGDRPVDREESAAAACRANLRCPWRAPQLRCLMRRQLGYTRTTQGCRTAAGHSRFANRGNACSSRVIQVAAATSGADDRLRADRRLEEAQFAKETTNHPAYIPREVAGSSRKSPPIPAYPRSARKSHDRPVTPEVAGSSPVAPVKRPANGIFCCRL